MIANQFFMDGLAGSLVFEVEVRRLGVNRPTPQLTVFRNGAVNKSPGVGFFFSTTGIDGFMIGAGFGSVLRKTLGNELAPVTNARMLMIEATSPTVASIACNFARRLMAMRILRRFALFTAHGSQFTSPAQFQLLSSSSSSGP